MLGQNCVKDVPVADVDRACPKRFSGGILPKTKNLLRKAGSTITVHTVNNILRMRS